MIKMHFIVIYINEIDIVDKNLVLNIHANYLPVYLLICKLRRCLLSRCRYSVQSGVCSNTNCWKPRSYRLGPGSPQANLLKTASNFVVGSNTQCLFSEIYHRDYNIRSIIIYLHRHYIQDNVFISKFINIGYNFSNLQLRSRIQQSIKNIKSINNDYYTANSLKDLCIQNKANN